MTARILTGVAALFLLGILATGCASGPEADDAGKAKSRAEVMSRINERTRRDFGRKPKKYRPLHDYKLKLEATSRRVFTTGKDAELVFVLRNLDRKPVHLEDWHVAQADNIRLYIQNWFPEMKGPDEKAWIDLNAEPASPDLRYPLDLLPGNQAIISKSLPFVRDLTVSPNAERRYFVKAELTLETVQVATPVFGIAVQRGIGQ